MKVDREAARPHDSFRASFSAAAREQFKRPGATAQCRGGVGGGVHATTAPTSGREATGLPLSISRPVAGGWP